MSHKRDDSEFGGETIPGTMDPGPQPKPTKPDEAPTPDDPSREGSG